MSFSNYDLVLLLVLLASASVSIGYWVNLRQAVKELPRIDLARVATQKPTAGLSHPKTSVIIPAFNEEENIEDCVKSVLLNTWLPGEWLEVWVVDDQSTDRTLEILQALQTSLADPRLHIISGLPRPQKQKWTGKNWACHQAAERATGEFFLFIDADVRLKPNAILAVTQTAIERELDFLTCIPETVCGSLTEWLVQPLIFINVLISFNTEVVRDPKTKSVYALGPFLWFRASVYRTIGGHRAIAHQVAEDVALARNVKHRGFRLQSILGPNLASLRMYRTWPSLWEGWTKVLYVGAQRNLLLMVLLVSVMLLLYTVPWIALLLAIIQILLAPAVLHFVELGLALLLLLLQYWIRRQGSQALGTSAKYWWLQGIGGLLVAVLAIASIIKAETGWGWTWRGRKLAE